MVFSEEFPKETSEIGVIGVDNVIYKIARLKDGFLYSAFYGERKRGLPRKKITLNPSCLNNKFDTNGKAVLITTETYDGFYVDEDRKIELVLKNTNQTYVCNVVSVEKINDNSLKIIIQNKALWYQGEINKFDFFLPDFPVVGGYEHFVYPQIFTTPYEQLKQYMLDHHQELIINHGVSKYTLETPTIIDCTLPTKIAYYDTEYSSYEVDDWSQELYDSMDGQTLILKNLLYTDGYVFSYRSLEKAIEVVNYLTERKKKTNLNRQKENLYYNQPEEYQYVILKGEIPITYTDNFGVHTVRYVKGTDNSTNTASTALGVYEVVQEFPPFIY